MAADLSIHILEGASERDLAEFFSSTLGSKYFNLRSGGRSSYDEGSPWHRVADTPQVWIGEVSWLKASLSDDPETYVPDTVGQINELIGEELPVIDDGLIERIISAFDVENKTSYSLADPSEVRAFLEQYKGKRAFTVSW